MDNEIINWLVSYSYPITVLLDKLSWLSDIHFLNYRWKLWKNNIVMFMVLDQMIELEHVHWFDLIPPFIISYPKN